MRARVPRALGLLVLALLPRPALAALDAHEEARKAYDRGAAAHQRRDYATAARELARADELEPNTIALTAALRAALLADDAILGMGLVERAAVREPTTELTAAAAEVRASFRVRTAGLVVRCGACLATVDGAPIAVNRRVLISPGAHRVVLEGEGARRVDDVSLEPETTIDVALPAGTRPAEGHGGAWALAGGGLTAVLGGLAIWSGIDTSRRHADFVSAGCLALAGPTCRGSASDGLDAERRTNLLLGAAAIAGAGTLVAWWLSAP